ncbi:MAG: histidine kinase [Chitinophagales bacterium]|nr:histidine kinase [Chitinophagales bacterium]
MQKLLTLLIAHLLFAVVLAQHSYYYSINDEKGLPGNEVYYLLQDKAGFMWMGTSMGLYRYDGNEFKRYGNKKQNSRGISHLINDEKRRIWCQNFSGQIFYAENDSLHLAFDYSSKSNFPVFNLGENNTVYIASDSGIHQFENKQQTKFFRLNNNFQQGKICYITDLALFDSKLFYSEAKSVGYFADSQLHYISNTNRRERLEDVYKHSYLNVINKRLYLLAHGGQKNSVWEIRNDSLIWLLDLPEKLGRVFALHDDEQERIWVGGSNGTICYNYNFEEELGGQLLFPGKSISDVICDREGNYWFSTLQDGIFVVPSLDVQVYTSENSPLADTRVKRLETDGEGNLFIGYQNGKLSRFNIHSNKWSTVSFPNSPAEIQEMTWAPGAQKLVVGQNNSWLVDGKTLAAVPAALDINLKSVTPIAGDTFFLGSVNHANVAVLKNNFKKVSELRSKRTRCSFYDKTTKTLWVGYTDGLFVYRSETEKELTFDGKKVYATDIAQTADGKIWIGTVGDGLLFFDGERILKQEDISPHTANGFIRKLAAQQNTLWIACENSLLRFNTHTFTVDVLNRFDGLPSQEIAGMKILDDRIFIATPKGLVTFPANIKADNKVPPTVSINRFKIWGGDTVVHQSYTLPYSLNNIEIDFTGIGFRSLGEFQFLYRMSGLDSTWIETNSNSNFARFPSLPAGKYVFEVKALNEDRIESIQTAQIEIEILKPYWQRWWFFVLCGLLLTGIVSVLFALRIRSIRKKAVLEKRMANSQLAALKSRMNPHFMFNALNSIQDLVLQHETDNAQLYLGKFSELTRKVLDASGTEFISLQEEVEMLQLYLELEKLRFGSELHYTIYVDEQLDAEQVKIPSMIVQPFVENALKHGLLHKEGDKKLTVSFVWNKSCFLCTIEDNGIGRKASAEINSRRKKHKSFATDATAERIRLLNDFYRLKIAWRIIDQQEGTKVEIQIPEIPAHG